MGLNRPIYVQYLDYLWKVAHGDFGTSLNNKRPVLGEITLRLPSTLELTVAAMAFSTVLGVGLGVVAALKHNTLVDSVTMMVAMVGISMPIYWSSLLLIMLLSVDLKWLPPNGQGSFNRLIMPALALGYLSAGALARLVRSSMLEVLNQDYVLTARAKGLREWVVIMRHTLRNALIPIVTVLGLSFGELLGGGGHHGDDFARLGIGRMYVDALLNKDFTLVQGTTLFVALAYVLNQHRHRPDLRLTWTRGFAMTDVATLGRPAGRVEAPSETARMIRRALRSRNIRIGGAVLLVVIVLTTLGAAADVLRSPRSDGGHPAQSRRARNTCLAPTISAATSSRACSTAGGCRSRSGCCRSRWRR